MSNSINPLQSNYTRVFLIEGRAAPDHKPSYESCMKLDAITHPFGDTDPVYCPDPDSLGAFVEVGSIQGEQGRPSTSLIGRYAADLRSTLLKLGQRHCPFDVQLHIGARTNPSYFSNFQKNVILEDVRLSQFSTDPLGALSPDENASVTETGAITCGRLYEIMPITLTDRGKSVVTVELIDVVICDSIVCGVREDASDGCQKVYSVSSAVPASPGTVPELVFSLDGGVNLLSHDVDSLVGEADGLACVGDYIVVISNADAAHHYASKSEIDDGDDPLFAQAAGGYVAGGEPNDIWSVGDYAFIVGDGGYVYALDNATAAVTVLDAGVATSNVLRAVHALSDEFAVAVGDLGTVIYTADGEIWTQAAAGCGLSQLNCVWVKNAHEWFVGSDDGHLYYTKDGGETWTEKAFPGSGSGSVRDIQFATASVAWMSHDTDTPRGRILRSYDGGHEWIVTPEGDASIPANDRINAIAACKLDPNIIFGVGLGDDGADGVFLVGKD